MLLHRTMLSPARGSPPLARATSTAPCSCTITGPTSSLSIAVRCSGGSAAATLARAPQAPHTPASDTKHTHARLAGKESERVRRESARSQVVEG
eukprot:2987335-Rhodomonas_salina.1